MSNLFGSQNSTVQQNSGISLFSSVSDNTNVNKSFTNSSSMPNQPNNNQPTWFSNPKKRVIPNHLVPKKKAGFHISSSALKKDTKNKLTNDSNSFNLVSFGGGAGTSKTVGNNSIHDITGDLTKFDETINETSNEDMLVFQNDLPPSRSIYDLNEEVLTSFNDASNNNSDSFLNKNPKNFNNVFNKNDTVTDKKNDPSESKDESSTAVKEAAVLVFGYPESMANEVIQYFSEFGPILEQFEVTKPKNAVQRYYQIHHDYKKQSKTIAPVFTGNSWVKLTYDNPQSAIAALQESGAVFNGVLLGVIPYSKAAVEKLQKKKVDKEEDIGGGLLEYQQSVSKPQSEAAVPDQASYFNRLDIKDGMDMFLHAKSSSENNKNAKLGILGTATRFLFGFNEL